MNYNILVISELLPYPPHRNGCSSSLFNFIKCWRRFGCSVDIIYCNERDLLNEHELEEQLSLRCSFINLRGTRIISRFGNRWVFKTRNNWHIDERKAGYIDARQYNYVIIGNYSIAGFIDNILKNAACKFVFFQADSLSLYYKRAAENRISFVKRIYYYSQKKLSQIIERQIYKTADYTVFVSDVDTMYTKNTNKHGVFVCCPIGVDCKGHLKVIEGKKESGIIKIGFSGIMDYQPNEEAAEYIINQIIPELERINLNYRVYIIGKNPKEIWKTSKFVHESKLEITGFVEDIEDYISNMDIYVSPLWLGTGMKNKILQAMGVGVPVICSPISAEGINELIDSKNCYICDKHSRVWADKIYKLANDTDMRMRFTQNCLDVIKTNYTWDTSAKRMLGE